MATQIIQCPAELLQELRVSFGLRRISPDQPPITLAPLMIGEDCCSLLVGVDHVWLTWDRWPSHDDGDVFVLVLTSDPKPHDQFTPRPLPHHMVTPLIDALAEQAGTCLTGHAWMELAAILERAKTMPNDLPLVVMRRAPRSRFERKLVETAWRLQGRWSSVLQPLQRGIAEYGADLLRTNVGSLVDSLSTEGGVVDYLNLSPGEVPGLWRITSDDPAMHHAIATEIEKARRIRNTNWWVASALCPYSIVRRADLSLFYVRELYRAGFAHPGTDYDAPLWRREDFNGCEFPERVPAAGIEAALSRFVGAFDRQLLAGTDPVIRAALAMFHLLRIEPVGRRDRDAALLLFYTLLREAGLPPMPVLLVMHERYWQLANVMVGALERDQPDGLVEIMIDVVRAAHANGVRMADQLARERQTLIDSLGKGGFAAESSGKAVGILLSTALIRIWSSSEFAPPGEAELAPYADHLHKDGLIDVIEIGGRHWWSSPFTRDLAATRASR
jgi:hypothetical protein